MRTELDDCRHYTLALRPGTLLDGAYRITHVLAQSSTFAVTYLAQDERADNHVVVKEFLPRTLAGRARDELTVLPHSAEYEVTLARALRRFKREAELLADIAHPNIPRARRCVEANGTAYLVLEHYEGRTLAEHAAAAGDRLPADRASGLVLQVLQGLEALHAEGIIHGYLTPETILVDANSRALILGLGTTRHVVGAAREPMAGFAPIEQYVAKDVGPWTDVYACAAILYRLTTGLTPPSAVERSAGQTVALPWTGTTNVPAALTRAVMSGLAQLPDARPHSAEGFRRRLDASLALGAQAMAPRADQRINARWPAADPAESTATSATAESAQESEVSRLDEDGLVTNADAPSDRVRRLLKLVLGI
ncbi:MAG: serine/threonine protein kinase, partial [Gemmatimonadota bacterium]|nr:serine/threonine protein kinase [Gemmatimonadota bacterium]